MNFDEKKNNFSNTTFPLEGYIAKAVREFYSDLKNVKHDNPDLKAAFKFGKRCCNQLDSDDISIESSRSRYRKAGGERKITFPEVRDALLD